MKIKLEKIICKTKFRPEKMRMAVDGATNISGYAIFDGTKRVESGSLQSFGKNAIEKSNSMAKLLQGKIKQYGVEEVIIEDIQCQRNIKTFKTLAQTRGVLLNAFFNCNVSKVVTITASQWRSALKIRQGRGVTRDISKAAAMEYMKKNYNLELGEDETEAILIMLAYIGKNIGNKK